MEVDINTGSMEDTSALDHDRFKKGKKVLYDGKEAKVIGIKPLLIIKIGDRIICGALHEQIEFIEEWSILKIAKNFNAKCRFPDLWNKIYTILWKAKNELELLRKEYNVTRVRGKIVLIENDVNTLLESCGMSGVIHKSVIKKDESKM